MSDEPRQIELLEKVVWLQDVIIKKLTNEVQEGQDMAQALAHQVDEMGSAMADQCEALLHPKKEEKSEG